MKINLDKSEIMDEEHPGSRDMFNTIADWEPGPLVVSKSLGWGRFGILGILGGFVLSFTKGEILEIGMGESTIILTELAKRHNRECYNCDISHGDITNMATIPGIYHERGNIFQGSSDDFFKQVEFPLIALAFIDGDHIYEQVKKDFWNAYNLVVDNGYIFLHDTYPPNDEYLNPWRCGTVYKLRQELEERNDLDVFTFTDGAMEVGFTMIRKHPKNLPYYQKKYIYQDIYQKGEV